MGNILRHTSQIIVLYLKCVIAVLSQTIAVFRQELVVIQLRLYMLMRWVRRPLAWEVHYFADEEIGLRAVGAIKESTNQTGGTLVHLTCAALLVCAQAVLRTHEAGSKAALVFGACHCDFCVCAASDGDSGVLRNVQQNCTLMEAVLTGYGLGLAFPSEGDCAAHQIVNNFLCIVKIHDVACCHLDNAELHAHHFRIIYCGNHLIIALVKWGFCCVFHVDRSFVGMRFIKIKISLSIG